MLDTFAFVVIFSVVIGVLYAIGFLLWKAGLLKQALITLITVLLLGGVAIASGHAETEIGVIVVNDGDVITIFDTSNSLFWQWEEKNASKQYKIYDVVMFSLKDENNTTSILDDIIESKPQQVKLKIDRLWLVRALAKASSP
jgi:hypothetical protein